MKHSLIHFTCFLLLSNYLNAQTVTTFATGLSGPFGNVFDNSGNMFVTNYNNNTLSKINSLGTVSTFVSSGLSLPGAITIDNANNLYVTNRGSNSVSKITSAGVVSTFATSITPNAGSYGITIDNSNNLYVTNYFDSTIKKITSAGVVSTFVTGISKPYGITIDPIGNLYVGDDGTNSILQVSPSGTTSTFATGISSPYGLTYINGDIYVSSNTGTISKVTNTGTVTTYVSSGLNSPMGLCANTTGNLFVCNIGTNSILKVTPPITLSPLNSLYFNGTNNYIDLGSNTITSKLTTNKVTGEAWINIKVASSFGTVMKNWGDNNHGAFHFGLSGTTGRLDIAITQTNGTVVNVTSPNVISLNTWHHVAFTLDGTNINLYEDGVLVASTTYNGTLSNAIPVTYLGAKPNDAGTGPSSGAFSGYFNGLMDEVRIWNTALTQAEIRTNMYNYISPSSTGLVAYYTFNSGIASGNNAGIITLNDSTSNNYNGTLKNFALSGSISNWVESYAMVVPEPNAASGITTTGFTASWSTPLLGTVDNGYRLEVSTSPQFLSSITGSPFTVNGLTQNITGLNSGTVYYYRVKADKTSVTGQGGFHYNSPISVTTINATVAITPGSIAPFCDGLTSTILTYTNPVSNPTNYSIVWDAPAITAGFLNITDSALRSSLIYIKTPTGINGNFTGTLSVRNASTTSVNYPVSITIYANPVVAAIVGPSSVCQTKTITLTNSTSGGVWSSSNNSIASISTTGLVTGIAAGNVVISYSVTNANNCTTVSTYNIVVNEVPSRTSFKSDTLICKGTSLNINATIAAPATYLWTSANTGFTSSLATVSLTQDDLYKLTITLNNGCVIRDSINVLTTSDPAIKAKMAITAQAFINQNVIAVNLTTPTPQTQNWVIPSGAQIVSQNANMLVLKFANKGSYMVGLNNTSYTVCTSKDSGKVVISNSDSVLVSNTNIVIVREVAVSPNPSVSGIFNLNIKLNRTGKVSIKVFNLFGLQVYSKIIPESSATTLNEKVDLSALPNDTYVAVIQTANANEIRKMMKN
ncbi:MAG: Ig-like domain-containing protein [Chitinophagaceae bacterium]|nr:Ig-like domain-containing protein [Chitinophagaceae bacterium]